LCNLRDEARICNRVHELLPLSKGSEVEPVARS